MSKYNAYLKDENLLTLFSLNNMIVPEIQREYVWGNNSDVLEKFLQELEKKASPCQECHHVHTNKNINVGFLYSYKPSYVKYESERILDEFLIDGQQRITTLFLLLLYRSTIEKRIDDFLTICRADEDGLHMGFNYKVRSLTQQFLVQLIRHAKDGGCSAFDFIMDLDNSPHWFLDDYKNDPTVMSMISALKSIKKIFGNTSNFYFDYLLTNIHFWHFKTEATSQGEELYITMNSRGEQLSDNEMQKSRVLPSTALCKYGCKWESWQTFFWRNRTMGNAQNANADKGFNNFRCNMWMLLIVKLLSFKRYNYPFYKCRESGRQMQCAYSQPVSDEVVPFLLAFFVRFWKQMQCIVSQPLPFLVLQNAYLWEQRYGLILEYR